MSAPDDMPLFSILEAQGESSIVEMYKSDLKLTHEEIAKLKEENALPRFKLFGTQSEKLGKLTEPLIEEPEGTGTTKTRKPVAPNNITRHYTYKEKRDLIATLNDKRGTSAVVNRSYAYNALGIPTNRTIQRQGTTCQDVFTHNDRSELTAATMGDKAFAYDYDKAPDGCKGDWTNPKGLPRRGEPPMGWRRVNIGNRKTAQEEANDFTYTANALNQYTQITENDTPFVPEFDADGNQIRIKTTTGIWTAVYNALNRPVTYTRENSDGTQTVITADYDYMGRRVFKKVETVTPASPDSESGEETRTIHTNHRYLYRGYLQIAALDLTRSTLNDLWLITWDPTQTIATRPLAIQKDGTWYTYGLDLPKNITELYSTSGYIHTTYTYSPYGLVTTTGNVAQPLQWSSEFTDTDLGLVYYNYRHYNPLDGRWTGRDPNGTEIGANLYNYTGSNPIGHLDVKGLSFEDIACYIYMADPESEYKTCREQCEKDLYYDNKAIERFVNSSKQANSSIGMPHGASPQEMIAVLLYVLAYAKYQSCLSDCTYAYNHNLKCKRLECPVIL